jgi:hypothetical protein
MLTALLVFSVVATPSIDAIDYFPLAPGTKWVFREEAQFAEGTYSDEVKDPINVGGESIIPVETRQNGKLVDTVHYRVSGDTISIFAYDIKQPLEVPRPVLRVGTGTVKWEYAGMTPFLGAVVPLTVKGASTPKGKRKVLDREVECLEVRFEARIGPPDKKPILSKQVAIYAKGIGLVEMQEKTTVDRKTEERKLKLVEFTPGRP